MTVSLVIADDDASVRTLLRRYVERDGRCRVVGEATDGRQALEVVGAADPDVLLLDLGMPVKDGLEVLAALVGTARPRTVVLTGFADTYTAERARELGAVACLVKGPGFAELPDVIVDAAGLEPPR